MADPTYIRNLSLKAPEASHSDLTICLEAIYHYLSLSLVLPEISEYLFLLWVVLSYPLQAALNPAVHIRRI